jgi:hypothetical protein
MALNTTVQDDIFLIELPLLELLVEAKHLKSSTEIMLLM